MGFAFGLAAVVRELDADIGLGFGFVAGGGPGWVVVAGEDFEVVFDFGPGCARGAGVI